MRKIQGSSLKASPRQWLGRSIAALAVSGTVMLAVPVGAGGTFSDDDGSVHEANIEAIAAANITIGCNPPTNTHYCPTRPVTRAEMATFLTRALNLPPSATDYFTDDNTSLHEGNIQAIAAANITIGCNPPTNTHYCPTRPVTRAEMATFLTRALNLTPVEPPPDPPPPTGATVVFAAGGDLGAETSTGHVLNEIGSSDAEFLLALGDLSYNHVTPESEWCKWVDSHLGTAIPVQMAVGNHEHDHGSDGAWDQFAQCLPDAMSSTGDYPAQYFFDIESVRVIVVSAGLTIDGHQYTYAPGSADADWLIEAIQGAKVSGKWVVVGTHKPCISVGKKECEPGPELTDLLITERADVLLAGHDHNYQRSHQLSCITVDSFDDNCVADSDNTHAAGAGTVLVVSAAFRDDSLYAVSNSDTEAGYFADFMGANSSDSGAGYVEVTASPTRLSVRFVGVTTNHSDSFEILK